MFITIDQIICLRTVYEEGSISKAAEKLFRAKSAINYALNNLEEQLGFKVLDKSPYRPRLTPKGEEFLFKSKKLSKEYNLFLENCQNIFSGVEMKLSLSASSICSLDEIYKVIKSAMKKYPSTEITLHREILSGEKMLEEDKVDLALFENLNNKESYEFKALGNFKLPLVIASDHPFLQLSKKNQTRDNLIKFPHIIQRTTMREQMLNRSIDNEEIKWEVTDILSKKELIEQGLGWGRLSDHMIKEAIKKKELVHLKHLDVDPTMEVFLCRKRNRVHGEVNNYIWNCF
jgi:DNA-binding transcriptional LysR family regulator